jgi:hypothetical protein
LDAIYNRKQGRKDIKDMKDMKDNEGRKEERVVGR